MKPIDDIIQMFTDWSEDELQTGLMLICKKFELNIYAENTSKQIDFIESECSWMMSVVRKMGNSWTNIWTEDSSRVHMTAPHWGALSSIHEIEMSRYYGGPVKIITKTDAMRSLLAMLSGCDVFDSPSKSKSLICHVPEFSSLEELKLKLELM